MKFLWLLHCKGRCLTSKFLYRISTLKKCTPLSRSAVFPSQKMTALSLIQFVQRSFCIEGEYTSQPMTIWISLLTWILSCLLVRTVRVDLFLCLIPKSLAICKQAIVSIPYKGVSHVFRDVRQKLEDHRGDLSC